MTQVITDWGHPNANDIKPRRGLEVSLFARLLFFRECFQGGVPFLALISFDIPVLEKRFDQLDQQLSLTRLYVHNEIDNPFPRGPRYFLFLAQRRSPARFRDQLCPSRRRSHLSDVTAQFPRSRESCPEGIYGKG